MADSVNKIAIVGGGIAGSAAALRAAQYHRRFVWLRGDKSTAKRSRSQWVANIDNMIGLHDGIVRERLLAALKGDEHTSARAAIEAAHHLHISGRDIIANTVDRIADQFGDYATIVDQAVTSAELVDGQFVFATGSDVYRSPYAVLATGVMDRQPLIKKAKGGQVRDLPKWIYPFANRETVLYCIRCEGHLTASSHTAVIGTSEAAAQLAMMLYERYGSACAVLTNGEEPAWSERSQKVLDVYSIAVHRARLVDVSGTKGQLNSIALEDGREVHVQFALVSLGLHRVYNDLARALGARLTDPDQDDEVRHVEIDRRAETSVRNLFAVGDMTRHADASIMKQVYTCQEYAVRAIDAIDGRIRRAQRQAALDRAG